MSRPIGIWASMRGLCLPGVFDPNNEQQIALCMDRPKPVAAPQKYNSTCPQCGLPMQCLAGKKEKRMACLSIAKECTHVTTSRMQSKTHSQLRCPLIQTMKHNIEIDASMGSHNSLHAMCKGDMQTNSLICQHHEAQVQNDQWVQIIQYMPCAKGNLVERTPFMYQELFLDTFFPNDSFFRIGNLWRVGGGGGGVNGVFPGAQFPCGGRRVGGAFHWIPPHLCEVTPHICKDLK